MCGNGGLHLLTRVESPIVACRVTVSRDACRKPKFPAKVEGLFSRLARRLCPDFKFEVLDAHSRARTYDLLK